MKAVIYLDVPEWQIGQEVSVYFPDSMVEHGKCEEVKEKKPCDNCQEFNCDWCEFKESR